MSVVTRYFDNAGAGSADGTSWANRANLYTAGAWSTVITGFNFSGSDSLLALIGPGTVTIGDALSSADFTNAPTNLNPLMFHGCDSSGNLLTPPDPDWKSCEPDWSDSALPVLATSSTFATITLATGFVVHIRLIKFTNSSSAGPLVGTNGLIDWCSFYASSSNNAIQLANAGRVTNCIGNLAGVNYGHGFGGANTSWDFYNCRVTGATGGSSGNRRGFSLTNMNGGAITNCTVNGCGLIGISCDMGSGMDVLIAHNTIRNAGSDGIHLTTNASPTDCSFIIGNMITGCGGSGIDGDTEARAIYSGNRLRDNTTANFSNITNTPTDWDNYTTDSDDATEYVNSGSGDLRIKYGATIWSGGYGAGRQDPPAGGMMRHPGMGGGING